mgnify:FL=1
MDKNQSLMLAAAVFGIIALLHLLRSIFSWPARIANFDVPLWLSYIAVVVAGYLAWLMYNASKK